VKNKYLSLFLRIAVSGLAVLAIIWTMKRGEIGPEKILDTLKSTNILLFGAGFLLFQVVIFLASWRLKIILYGQNINLSFNSIVHLTYVGYLFNNFLPTQFGGDAVKAYYAFKKTNKKAESFTCVFLDRLIGMFALLCIAAAAAVFAREMIPKKGIILFAFLILVAAAGFIILLTSRRVARRFGFLMALARRLRLDAAIKKVYEIIQSFRANKAIVTKAFFLSLILQGFAFYSAFILSRSLGIHLPVKIFFLFVPIVGVISMLPSLGGLGVSEGAYVFLFSTLILKSDALAFSLLMRLVLLIAGLIGGVIYIFSSQYRVRVIDNSNQ